VEKITPVVFDHITKWGDIDADEWSYFFETPKVSKDLLANEEKISLEKIQKHLKWIKNIIEKSGEEDFESGETIKALIFDYATEFRVGRRKLLTIDRRCGVGRARHAGRLLSRCRNAAKGEKSCAQKNCSAVDFVCGNTGSHGSLLGIGGAV